MLMSEFRQCVNVWNITVRIAEGLDINRPSVILNGCFYLRKVMNVYKAGSNTECWERMRQQVVAAPIYGLLCDKMTTVLSQGFQRICNCRRSGGKGQGSRAALQRCHPLLQYVLRGVRQSAVDIAGIGKAKTSRCMGRVPEHIRSSRIDGNCTGVSCRVRILLAYM